MKADKNYKTTVIIPIYKAEIFIERCLNSVFNQDLDDVEYILINDCTPDKSFEIAKQKAADSERKNDIKLIENETNLGIGKSRRKGMLAASGKYVIQIDSDDWIERNMLSTLYKKAEEEKSDVVTCDYYISFLNGKRKYRKEEYKADIDYNVKSIMLGRVHPSLCNTLVRREFYLKNGFIPTGEVDMGEDFETMFKVFLTTSKVAYVAQPFLHYTQYNTNSITKTMNASHIEDTIHSIRIFEKILEQTNGRYEEAFKIMLIFWKKMFLLDRQYAKYFYTVRPDVNKFEYLFSDNGYGFFQKITISFSLLHLPFITRVIYKTYRYLKKNF
ncbi:glycosyltransferase, group 2 family protein [Capnocytophaga cynodegmi]|uniref:Glycosyltransferase, group 2 family protein n=1 Tax=Capnocytophaga cynodegmi TaxID=28189 RepID=A0A250E6B0_9FLAO|nr:glycosyltransferase family 2 protein [Capnocytophaga cynodegmi]ATA68509.1 glycosyltransferase, group 2 family protein [Capnocytophaga cynodegmi]